MECINAFTIPVYKFIFNEHSKFKKIAMQYLTSPGVFDENTIPGRGLLFTRPDLHLNLEFQPFTQFIHDSINHAMVDLGYKPSTQITGLWGTKHLSDAGHHRHSHGNSFLAGVYYLHGNERSSGTIFHFPYNHTHIVPAKSGSKLKMSKFFQTRFEEGALYIFPAWLEHNTSLNNTDVTGTERYILSFNSMPVGRTNHDVFDRYVYSAAFEEEMIQSRRESISGL